MQLVKIVKIVYSNQSFTVEESDRGHCNLTHYLYLYDTDDQQALIRKALRPGAKCFVYTKDMKLIGTHE